MQNPTTINLATKNTWYLVAENVRNGIIDIQSYQPAFYYYTYVLTGEASPIDLNEAVRLNESQISISATDYIDVYMQCVLDSGKVVVSI
jgi:hypothetical protein